MANVGNQELLLGNLVKATSSTGVFLCILLAISYTAIIRLPGALDHAQTCVWYQLFLIFDSISFFSSVGGILLVISSTLSRLMSSSSRSSGKSPLPAADQACASTSPDGRRRLVETSYPLFVYLISCLLLSLPSAGCAYLFAGLAFLKVLTWQQVPVILMCVVGGLLYIDILLVKVVDLLRLSRECIRSQPQLWQATKRESVCGRLCTYYLEYVLDIGPMAPSASS